MIQVEYHLDHHQYQIRLIQLINNLKEKQKFSNNDYSFFFLPISVIIRLILFDYFNKIFIF